MTSLGTVTSRLAFKFKDHIKVEFQQKHWEANIQVLGRVCGQTISLEDNLQIACLQHIDTLLKYLKNSRYTWVYIMYIQRYT